MRKRSRQLVAESAVITVILLILTFGGSIATTASPQAWNNLSNPNLLNKQYDLNALARWYNFTLTQIGTGEFSKASLLIQTFRFVNIPTEVNQTALVANGDIARINSSVPKAMVYFDQEELAIKTKEYVDATALNAAGCSEAVQANKSFTDFMGVQTPRLAGQSVPTSVYKPGQDLTASEIRALTARCNALAAQLPGAGGRTGTGVGNGTGSTLLLLISSPQKAVETGGPVALEGNLTLNGVGVKGGQVLFYINGTYFGSLTTGLGGDLGGTLGVPFLYKPTAFVQAMVAPDAAAGLGGAESNVLGFRILFNATSIVIGDPPTYLPTQSFNVEGNLTTVDGVPLPQAPVKVTFFDSSTMATTNSRGVFDARLTVPADASDGVHYVYAEFAPQGAFGPSSNFTSVRVAHIPLVVAASGPGLSFAGFPTTIAGSATANGSAVAGAQVTVSTPWGTYHTATDSDGHFTVIAPVSPLDFAFSASTLVQANAAQPYISGGTVVARLGLLNLLLIVLPTVGIGVTVYEADRLDVFGRIRRRAREQALLEDEEEVEPLQVGPSRPLSELPEALRLFRRALDLAASRSGLKFAESQTIRESLSALEATSSGEGTEPFRRILLTAEDFVYSQEFDVSRLGAARGDLATLEEAWK